MYKSSEELFTIHYWKTSSPSRTGDEQHKDNKYNNNIINYVEFNTDSILDFSEKNYEHLVELLTNNAIDTIPSTTFSVQQNSTS